MCRQRGGRHNKDKEGLAISQRHRGTGRRSGPTGQMADKKGPWELRAKARTLITVDTEGGSELREGKGGKRSKSWGLVPHILGICSRSGKPEASGDVFVSLITFQYPRHLKKKSLCTLNLLQGCKILPNLGSQINFTEDKNKML